MSAIDLNGKFYTNTNVVPELGTPVIIIEGARWWHGYLEAIDSTTQVAEDGYFRWCSAYISDPRWIGSQTPTGVYEVRDLMAALWLATGELNRRQDKLDRLIT